MLINSIEEIRDLYENSPFNNNLGIQIKKLEVGNVVLELPITPSHINVNNSVHGGVFAGILDSVLGMTLRSIVKYPIVTINLNIHYVAPLTMGEKLIATAKVLQQGYRIMTGEAEITDITGKLLAKGIGTFKIIRKGK